PATKSSGSRSRTPSIRSMELSSLSEVEAFVTKDGSTIRELHHTAAQSLAEASRDAGQRTQRHYHARTEEIYLLTAGGGVLEVDGESREVVAGDAVLIPPGAWHELVAGADGARLLCMCAPPYSHDDTFSTSRLAPAASACRAPAAAPPGRVDEAWGGRLHPGRRERLVLGGQPIHAAHVRLLLGQDERHAGAGPSRTAGAAHAVRVRLPVLRRVEVDDV